MDIDKVFQQVEDKQPKKKKRVLSEKQLDALRRGREKAMAKRMEKLNKKAEKDMVKQDNKNLKQQRVLMKEQEKVREKLEKNKEENEIKEFKIKIENVKNNILSNIDDNNTFKTLRKYFNSIEINNKMDIDNLKNKLLKDIETIKNKTNN
jgi:Cft2 family RNA processing exonuclease